MKLDLAKYETDPSYGIPPDLMNAIADLEKAINSTLVHPRTIGKALRQMHPYLLNQLALGVGFQFAKRAGDQRLNLTLEKAFLEIWDTLLD